MFRLEALLRIRPWLWLGIALVGSAALAWHASTFLPFLADDALISARYAERFTEGKGLTWTDGERVEGYSNLLWVLASAALKLLGMDLITASRFLGLLGMASGIAAFAWVYRLRAASDATGSGGRMLPGVIGVLALAASGPLAVWLIGGLEQPLVAGLLAWAIALSLPLAQPDGPKRILGPAIPLALLCLTRPDGALYTATIALGIGLARGVSTSSLLLTLKLSLLPAATFLAQLGFRLAYYGDWVSNPARVKVAFTSTRLIGGLKYVGWGYFWLSGLTLLALFGLMAARDPARRRRLLLIGIPLVVWSVYVSVVGGEIFPGRRHVVPIAVLLAFFAAEGLAWAAERGRRWHAAGWGVGVLCLGLLAFAQLRDPENDRAKKEKWLWAGEPIGRMLGTAFAEAQPLMAVDPAGCLPYWSKLPSLDMLGLNDRWIAMNPPANAGHGHFAHEFGNGAYVFSRQPDLVLFCGPRGSERGCFRGDRELLAQPGFRTDYQLVTFEGKVPFNVHSKIFVRKESGKIGIQRSQDGVEVPGYLLASTKGSLAVYLDKEERLAARLLSSAHGKLGLELPPGSWRLDFDAYGSNAKLEVRAGKKLLASGPAPLEFVSAAEAVELTLVPEGKTIVRDLRLQRVERPIADESPTEL